MAIANIGSAYTLMELARLVRQDVPNCPTSAIARVYAEVLDEFLRQTELLTTSEYSTTWGNMFIRMPANYYRTDIVPGDDTHNFNIDCRIARIKRAWLITETVYRLPTEAVNSGDYAIDSVQGGYWKALQDSATDPPRDNTSEWSLRNGSIFGSANNFRYNLIPSSQAGQGYQYQLEVTSPPTSAYTIMLEVALMLSGLYQQVDSSTNPDGFTTDVSIPEIVNDYKYYIEAGVKSRLMEMVDKPWSDLKVSVYWGLIYSAGIRKVRNHHNTNFGVKIPRARLLRWV